uniref:NitT/TauT family transport system substrate-binding protein n=1 Tax=Candidatus Kentrum sp. FM TaxID=2126340 RepID=A0A450SEA3_9GAMM|nr:MAG: NitT/TauT family transport system substrate-binding protein [Candidatus Kentron sp. FM]VFJ68472.1 MAG: NitT/TauT family transport system substrate-binding protein [Candidatus Kentron sp. FM]VFK12142.1 MAG: NitT/TauT family transport system substrate-binding protein [Candidatus Kentron sp. FM]
MSTPFSVILSLILAIVFFSLPAAAADPRPVRIASGGHIVHFLPLDIAVAHGFFEEQGLEPHVTYVRPGTPTAQALLAGQVDFSTNGIEHAFKAAIQGKDNLRMVVLMNRLPGMVLVADSKYRGTVQGIADLKGLTLGVTSKGAATHMVLNYLLTKNGVSPNEVTVMKAGASTFPPALQNAQIDGGMALEPFASLLVENGHAFVLADLTSLENTEKVFGGPYNLAGILTRQAVIDRDPVLVGKVVLAIQKALRRIATHSPEEIADTLPAVVVGTDKARYVKTLKKLREFYSLTGRITPAGVDSVFRSMQVSGALPVETPIEKSRFYTNRFVVPERL